MEVLLDIDSEVVTPDGQTAPFFPIITGTVRAMI